MSIICNVYHSTRDFSFHPDLNSFTVEESTLSQGRVRRTFGQVYDDAADEGFILVSHKTGDSVVCALHHVDTDGEDVAGWHYRVVAVQGKKPGQWRQVRDPVAPYNFDVLVIND